MNTQQSTFDKGAIGLDDFKELIESGKYIDQRLFIKDVITDAFKVPLITRPRRWGKSSEYESSQNLFRARSRCAK